MRALFMDFKLEIELKKPLDFSSIILVLAFCTPSDIIIIKGIRKRYAQRMALQSIFKCTVDTT